MRKLIISILLFPCLVFAGTNEMAPNDSWVQRTSIFPVATNLSATSTNRYSVQVANIFSLIQESDFSWLDTAIVENSAVALNTAKRTYPLDDESKLALIENSATADQTGAEIKTAYENEADTNALTDALKSKLDAVIMDNEFSDPLLAKLNSVDYAATVDQTGAEISDAINVYLGTTDWQSGGTGGASQLDGLSDISNFGTLGYFLRDDGDGTYSMQPVPSSISQLDELTDVTNSGTNGQHLSSNGDGTYTFETPTPGEMNVQPDWSETDSGLDTFIANKPTTISTTQATAITTNTAKRTYPSADELKLATLTAGAEANIQPDWDEADTGADAYINNKPTIISTAQASAISTNTLKRSYPVADEDKLAAMAPDAEANVNADWTAVGGDAEILHKPTLGTAADNDEGDFATAAQGALAATATQPADLGTAAAEDTGLDIGDVLVVADVGTCSNTSYTDQTTCESNSGTWTAKAGIAMDMILYDEAPTADGQLTLDATNHSARIQAGGTDYTFAVPDNTMTFTNKSISGGTNTITNLPTSAYATGSVGTDALATGGVGNEDLADDSVSNAKLRNDSVDSAEIVAGAVDAVHLSIGAVDNRYIFTTTASNAFTVGKVGFVAAAGTITLADASAEATAKGLLTIATGTISGGASGTFRFRGMLTVTSHGFTVGAPLFVSETAGDLTTTAPTTSGAIVRVVGYAIDANTIMICPDGTWIEI